jgi:hypothetical protein
MEESPVLTIVHGGEHHVLTVGEQLTFGRAEDAAGPAHLGLSDNSRLHAQAGRVEVDDRGWLLANTGRWLHLTVMEPGTANRFDLAPGRVARVPYASCRVAVTTGDETVGFDASCPWLAGPSSGAVPDGPAMSGGTVDALGLDRKAGYYRALVALCLPRLQDPQSREVSSEAEIVRLLNRVPAEEGKVTIKAVERRLANVRRKVGLAAHDPYGGSAAGLEIRDAARQLADLALRTGAVTPADLVVLVPGGVGPGHGRHGPEADPGGVEAGEAQ